MVGVRRCIAVEEECVVVVKEVLEGDVAIKLGEGGCQTIPDCFENR